MSRMPIALAAAVILAMPPLAQARSICIQGYNIDHTEIKTDSVILFHMRDGSTYANNLPQRCVGLKAAINGFTYSPTNSATDEICDNLDSFRVNDGSGTGQVCLFGAFTKIAG
jgi:hypothetical protein